MVLTVYFVRDLILHQQIMYSCFPGNLRTVIRGESELLTRLFISVLLHSFLLILTNHFLTM